LKHILDFVTKYEHGKITTINIQHKNYVVFALKRVKKVYIIKKIENLLLCMMHKLYKMNDIKIKPMSPFQTTRVKI